MTFLGEMTADGWQLGLHDQSFVGWFTVASYLVATVLCLRVAMTTERVGPETHQRKFAGYWWVLTVVTLLLGLNKQLDLHHLFTQVMRERARDAGWYEQRRAYQFWFIVGFAVMMLVMLSVVAWLMWGMVKRTMIAMVGLCLVMFWVMMRAASFHHVDHPTDGLIEYGIGPVKIRWIIELSGIFLIIIGAASNLIWGQERRERRIEQRIIEQQRIARGKPTHAAAAMLGQFPQDQETGR